ncbi:MAG: aminoacyl-tRNA hydrolase [Candidatus Omnitrophota bacterium]
MKVILGLGNPGLRYRDNRHNLGYWVIEKLARAHKIKITQKNSKFTAQEAVIRNTQVLLAKPLTYMNLSGEAALAVIRQKQVNCQDILVVCDDVNLPLGQIRIRAEGRSGGHNGLRSIINLLKTEAFPRLRIGIGMPTDNPEGNLSAHVLTKFNKDELKLVKKAVEEGAHCCEVWLAEGIEPAMNRFNTRILQ